MRIIGYSILGIVIFFYAMAFVIINVYLNNDHINDDDKK